MSLRSQSGGCGAWAAWPLCKRRELTCPHACHLSALVSDRVASMAAVQVRAGLLAAVSPSKSHQSTSPALSVPDAAPPASRSRADSRLRRSPFGTLETTESDVVSMPGLVWRCKFTPRRQRKKKKNT